MNDMYLIVETPRVDDKGHRFLVPSLDRNDQEIARIVSAAAEKPKGAYGVAVTRSVDQDLKGRALRNAKETIVLVGVAGDQLTDEQAEKVQERLEALWGEVDKILKTLANRGEESGTLIRCPELNDWLRKLPLTDLPRALPQTASKGRARGWAAAFAGFVLAAGALAWTADLRSTVADLQRRFWDVTRKVDGRPNGSRHPIAPQPGGVEKTEKEQAEHIVNQLARSWDRTPEAVADSILRAMDKRVDENPIGRLAVEVSSDEAFLDKLKAIDPKHPEKVIALLPESPTAEVLRDLLPSNPTPGDILESRLALHKAWESFENLRKKAGEAKMDFDKYKKSLTSSQPSGFRQTIEFSGIMPLHPPKLGEGFVTPTVPVFDKQDIEILQFLETWLRGGQEKGLTAAFAEVEKAYPAKVKKGYPAGGRFGERLNWMKENTNAIKDGVVNERGQVLNTIPVLSVKPDSNTIGSAYVAAEDFLGTLCNLARR